MTKELTERQRQATAVWLAIVSAVKRMAEEHERETERAA
jgi:hypothetical protein